jgi:DNA replication protein DnaC
MAHARPPGAISIRNLAANPGYDNAMIDRILHHAAVMQIAGDCSIF